MYDTQMQAQKAYVANGIASGAVQGLNAPVKQTVAVEIVNQIELINSTLRDVITSQRNLLDRLHGPRPENPCCEASKSPNMGILGTIEERINWLRSSSQELLENQRSLDRLA